MQALNMVIVRAQNAGSQLVTRRPARGGGQTLVEYALIIALVAIAASRALGFLSGKIQGLFSKAGSSLGPIGLRGAAARAAVRWIDEEGRAVRRGPLRRYVRHCGDASDLP